MAGSLPRLSRMYAAGAQVVRRRTGTILAVYATNLVFGASFTAGAAMLLASLYGQRPLFDRGVDGDLAALAAALGEGPDVATALVWSGLALALIYFVASQYLAGGVLERLRDPEEVTPAEARRRFGAGAAAHLGRFLRLWLWTWLLWIPAGVAGMVGLSLALRSARFALGPAGLAGPLGLAMLPALFLAAIAASTGDYARLLAVRDPSLPPRAAFFHALKLVLTRPWPLVHWLSYLAAWLLVSGLYVLMTSGYAFAGVGGAWILWVLRQLLVLARVTLRACAYGGQQVLVDE